MTATEVTDPAAQSPRPDWWPKKGPLSKVPVRAIRKLGRGSSGKFVLDLENGNQVLIGTVAELSDPRKFSLAIMGGCRVAWMPPKLEVWLRTVQKFLDAAGEGEDLGTDPEGEMRTWLTIYIGTRADVPLLTDGHTSADVYRMIADLQGKDVHGAFYWMPRRELVIRPEALLRWVTVHYGQRTSASELRLRLRLLHFYPKQIFGRDGDQTNKIRVWISPPGFDPDA